MFIKRIILVLVLIILGFLFYKKYNPFQKHWATGNYSSDSILVFNYYHTAEKITQIAFPLPSDYAKAIVYYDSALQIAKVSNDALLLAKSYNGLGLAYDAWMQNPTKTIESFTNAIKYYKLSKSNIYDEKYVQFLLAHTYMKLSNYKFAIITLDTLCQQITLLPDSIKKTIDFSVLIARTYSFSKEFKKAEICLNTLTKREWIANNDSTYNFLNYYYLIKTQIDIYLKKQFNTQYLDSSYLVFKKLKDVRDITIYGMNLVVLYDSLHNNKMKLEIQNYIKEKQKTIKVSEDNALNASKIIEKVNNSHYQQDIDLKKKEITIYKKFFGILTIFGIIIGALALYLFRSKKQINKQKQKLDYNIIELENKYNEIELLNREMHHRVKNNLQMMQSLMLIQAKQSQDNTVVESMNEMSNRIKSIADMHNCLFEQNENINLSDYINNLINMEKLLINKKITSDLNIENINLSHKNILSLGLIFNEWITNSAKYCKPLNDEINITIKILNSINSILIEYFDNGIMEQNKEQKNGMGFTIINLLAKQVNGTITHNNKNKHHYILKIITNAE